MNYISYVLTHKDERFRDIIKGYELEIIKFLVKNELTFDNYDDNSEEHNKINTAAKFNKMEILKYLVNEGYTGTAIAIIIAIENNNIEMVEYFYNCGYFHQKALSAAVSAGNFKILSSCYGPGYEWKEIKNAIYLAIKNNQIEMAKHLISYMDYKFLTNYRETYNDGTFMEAAILSDNLEMVKFIHNDKHKGSEDCLILVKNFEIFKFLHACGYQFRRQYLDFMDEEFKKKILTYIDESNKNLENVLKWSIDNDKHEIIKIIMMENCTNADIKDGTECYDLDGLDESDFDDDWGAC